MTPFVDLGYEIGYTPLFSADTDQSFELAKLLIQNGAKIHSEHREITLSQIACQHGHLDMVKLLESPPTSNIHQHSVHERTNLFIAAFNGKFEIVKFLIDSGANICEETKNGLPIHGVIQGWRIFKEDRYLKILQILTTPETVNSSSFLAAHYERKTPLRLAVEKGLHQVVKFLLRNGAIPDENDLLAARNEQINELLKNEIEMRKLNHNCILGV